MSESVPGRGMSLEDGRGRLDRLAELLVPRLGTLGRSGSILTPLLLVLGVALTSTWAARVWAASAPAGSAGPLLQNAGGLVWILAAASPVAVALKGTLLALLAWGVLVLLGGAPPMRPLVSALFYGEVLLALQALWVTGAALVLDLPAPGPGRLMPVASGLDAWVTSGNGAVLAMVQSVTPFHLAWVVFLGLAFALHAGVSRWRGLAAALLLWAFTVGLAVLRAPAP
ncbi:MAG: hypothetical protein Q8N53_18255 [Longimicrobiales bacterium]|nr:hypothetical protein [Longimicrobiales bacterium]